MNPKKDSFIINRIKSLSFALNGIIILIKTENSIKTHLFISILVIFCGLYFQISIIEWILQTICIGVVLLTESLNTAIERIANFVNPDYNKDIGLIKDIGAGAVVFTVIMSAIVGILIYLPILISL
jgi:diacylglycerol kinase (ATP)